MLGERPLILMIDDNAADIELTREALREVNMPVDLDSVRDGLEALAYLRRQGGYADRRRPDLLFLDLNMPRMDGRETLTMLKAQEETRDIPVVVLTTSESEHDVLESYRNYAAAFLTKPVTIDELIGKLRVVCHMWLNGVASLPRRLAQGSPSQN